MRPPALAFIALVFFCASIALPDEAPVVKMSLLPNGAMRKIGGYRPQRLKLSAERPGDLKKSADLKSPLYGKIEFGGKQFLVALDEPEDKDSTLYVDANGNGDLTDDPAIVWNKQLSRQQTGPDLKNYMGTLRLPLSAGDKSEMVSLGVYRFDKNDPRRKELSDSVFYYADYAYDGDITIGSEKYHAMLVDDNAKGDFRGVEVKPKSPAFASGVRLLIDLDRDGRFASRGEMFDAKKPFNINGTTWEVADLTSAGSFKIVKSSEEVADTNLGVGKKVPSFKATKMDGSVVNFPADYKGKIVMLDFWATWCGPCMMEVPGLVNAYNDLHPKGFEVLGISLDQPNAADKVKSVTSEKGMTWPQVYDGKFWQAEVAQLYGIESIPAPFLVDGDTGKVLAVEASLRGESLAPTIRAALEAKAKQSAHQ